MKVLLVNNCYPYYSKGKLVRSIESGLKNKGYRAIVAFAWGEKKYHNPSNGVYRYGVVVEKNLSAALTRLTGNLYGYTLLSTLRLIEIIKNKILI